MGGGERPPGLSCTRTGRPALFLPGGPAQNRLPSVIRGVRGCAACAAQARLGASRGLVTVSVSVCVGVFALSQVSLTQRKPNAVVQILE